MNNNQNMSLKELNTGLAKALQKANFEEVSSIINTNYQYHDALITYFNKNKKNDIDIKKINKVFDEIAKIKECIYKNVADSIIKWHKEYTYNENSSLDLIVLIIMQILISLIKKSKCKNDIYERCTDYLFLEYIHNNVFNNPYNIVIRAIYSFNNRSNDSKQRAVDYYNENRSEIEELISFITFVKIKSDVSEGNMYYCNLTNLTQRWLNAARIYFGDFLTIFDSQKDDMDRHNNTKTNEDEDCINLTENQIIKLYAYCLIPHDKRLLFIDYYYYNIRFNANQDNINANILARWKRNIKIYKIAFENFLAEYHRGIILKEYEDILEDPKKYNNFLDEIFDKNIIQVKEMGNSIFYYWDKIACKLISYEETTNVKNKFRFSVLKDLYVYKRNPKEHDNDDFPKIIDIIYDWQIHVCIELVMHAVFIKDDEKRKLIIVLTRGRRIDINEIIDYCSNHASFKTDEKEINKIINKWTSLRTRIRINLTTDKINSAVICLTKTEKNYSKEEVIKYISEKYNEKLSLNEVNSVIEDWNNFINNTKTQYLKTNEILLK
jgi:hypothetical protein